MPEMVLIITTEEELRADSIRAIEVTGQVGCHMTL